jgi:hypothetical protein
MTKHEATRRAPRAAAEAECPGPGYSRPPALAWTSVQPPPALEPPALEPDQAAEPGCPGLERQNSAPWRVADMLSTVAATTELPAWQSAGETSPTAV